MRKLTAGNKISFSIFILIIILIIVLLVITLNVVLGLQKTVYTLESNTFLYDAQNNPIELEETTQMQEKWNGNFYIKNPSDNKEYNLGKQVVTYDINRKAVNLYGTMYQVYLNGDIEKIANHKEISNTQQDEFYKLADRKYLIISNNIKNETGSLQTSGYLLLIIDKAGNTWLLNNEVNSRTIKPMVLETSTFKLDIANEKLIHDSGEIDLKKIIGSTNQYKEKVQIADKNNTENATQNIIQNGGQIAGANGGQTVIENNKEQTNITGNIQIGNGTENEIEDEKENQISKSVNLKSVNVTSSYIDVNYYISDPANKYQTVYLILEGMENKTIALDKSKNTYRITNLTPNTEYKLTLGAKALNSDGTLVDNIEDMVNVRTKSINANLQITKIGINKIYYNFKMDANYPFSSAKLVLYIDGEKKSSINIDTKSAATSNRSIRIF